MGLGGGVLGVENPDKSVLRMRGVPYIATETDVEEFLIKAKVKAARVHLIREAGVGRPSGVAYAELVSDNDVTKAMTLSRVKMGKRYIEMSCASQTELNRALNPL